MAAELSGRLRKDAGAQPIFFFFPPFCLSLFPTLLFIDSEGRRREKETRTHKKRLMPFLLHLPSPVLLRSHFPLRVYSCWMKNKRAKTGQGMRGGRGWEGGGERQHTVFTFTTERSKSAWREDAPVSNSQIKQALIKTLIVFSRLTNHFRKFHFVKTHISHQDGSQT